MVVLKTLVGKCINRSDSTWHWKSKGPIIIVHSQLIRLPLEGIFESLVAAGSGIFHSYFLPAPNPVSFIHCLTLSIDRLEHGLYAGVGSRFCKVSAPFLAKSFCISPYFRLCECFEAAVSGRRIHPPLRTLHVMHKQVREAWLLHTSPAEVSLIATVAEEGAHTLPAARDLLLHRQVSSFQFQNVDLSWSWAQKGRRDGPIWCTFIIALVRNLKG